MSGRLLIGLSLLALCFAWAEAVAQTEPGAGSFASDRNAPATPAHATILPPTRLVAPSAPADGVAGYQLEQLVRLGLEQNPRLAQAVFTIDAARGRAIQAGLYPNPTVSATFDELGDRQGPAGINTVPLISQEIVTGGKLTLSRSAAEREVDQATLTLAARRAELLASVRAAYFDLLTLQRRVELLRQLQTLSQHSVDQTRRLLEAKQATRLDLVQLEVEAERIRAEAEAAQQELPGAFRRLAAAVGVRELPPAPLTDPLETPLPDYELDRVRQYVLTVHPELRSAQVGVERAKLLWRRAVAEPIPNFTVSGGYVRQNQNKSDDYTVGVSVPVPVWNRNEGNILAAQAQIGEAAREVQRVENELTDRVAAAHREYASARKRAERLAEVQKKAEEAFRLIAEEKNFIFTTVQRLVSQQAVVQARLDHLKALGDAWRAASTLSGLTLEEQWPPALPAKPPARP
jgi:cobalt-zinc-cadmium efflux system outer membrane protein